MVLVGNHHEKCIVAIRTAIIGITDRDSHSLQQWAFSSDGWYNTIKGYSR
jgi:hypothetical protein